MTDLEWAGKTVLQQKLGTSLGTKQPSCPAWNVAGGGVARRRHKEGVQRPLVPLWGKPQKALFRTFSTCYLYVAPKRLSLFVKCTNVLCFH